MHQPEGQEAERFEKFQNMNHNLYPKTAERVLEGQPAMNPVPFTERRKMPRSLTQKHWEDTVEGEEDLHMRRERV